MCSFSVLFHVFAGTVLLGASAEQLVALAAADGQPAYRGKQLADGVRNGARSVADIAQVCFLSLSIHCCPLGGCSRASALGWPPCCELASELPFDSGRAPIAQQQPALQEARRQLCAVVKGNSGQCVYPYTFHRTVGVSGWHCLVCQPSLFQSQGAHGKV
jgi:hypothetical protein